MWEIPPCSVSTSVPFSRIKSPSQDFCNTRGRISHDGTWSWIAQNSILEVFTVQTREQCSFYNFGARLKNPMPIVAISELTSTHIYYPCLLVAVDMSTDGSMLCLFNVKTSKITSAIHLPYKVTSIGVVSSVGGATVENQVLHKQLCSLFGIVAVGTEGGNVLLLDLRLDSDDYSDELMPNSASIVNKTLHNLPAKREVASTKSQHICIYLNDNNYSSDTFEYTNNNKVLAKFSSDDVLVSALRYVRCLTSLVVGFNFGGIQLWNLQYLTLEISIPLHTAELPLVHFTFQEPENDPRNFCYLWAIRGHHQGEHLRPEAISIATLYSFTYAEKNYIPRYGYLYQDLDSCSERFEFPLKEDPYNPLNRSLTDSSRLISCEVISQTDLHKPESDDQLQNDEWSTTEDLGICLLSWENWSKKRGDCPESSSIAIFDINQWYRAQMPSIVRCNYREMCSYLGVFSLTEVTKKMDFNYLLDLFVIRNSLGKFHSVSTAEEVFFPTSLSFEMWCLSPNGTVHASYLGVQKQLLAEMNVVGPNILVDPKDLFSRCLSHGLLNHLAGTISSKKQMNASRQREMLLTLALEHNMIQFLNSCVQSWKYSEFSHTGCTSVFLLKWVWKQVTQIKTSIDKLCQPLFDCSGQELDETSLITLHTYKSRLKYLSVMVSTFQKYSVTAGQSQHDLDVRKEVIDSISVYLHVLTWLHSCKLLPEHNEGDDYGDDAVAFPVVLLGRSYTHRRQELQNLHSSVSTNDILLIDGIVDEFDSSLLEMWEDKGGFECYPPSSIYAAVSSYLIKDTPLSWKHMLMYYLILDLSAYLSDRKSHLVGKLSKFCSSLSINSSLSRLTQAFWCLDHKDFETAVSMLMHPMILSSDITPWQHQRIIKSLLCQDQPQLALKYINVRKPAETTDEAVKLHLSVLLANGLIGDALFFIRQHQDDQELLTHLFLGCQQNFCLESLFQLPLNSFESLAMTNYFNSCKDPKAPELLVMYYLLQCRPLEAAALNEKLSIQGRDPKSREQAGIRNALVSGFVDCLPDEQKRLAAELSQMVSQPTLNAANLSPLSTNITSRTLLCMSHADVLQNIIEKCSNLISEKEAQPFTPFRSWKRNISTTPFIRPAITPKSRKRQRSNSLLIGQSPEMNRDFDTPVKRSRAFDIKSFRLDDDDAEDQRKSKSSVADDVLSLLQTPTICRRSSRDRSPSVEKAVPEIVSILKRRDASQRAPSPLEPLFARTPSVCSEMSRNDEVDEDDSENDIEIDDSGGEKEFVPSKLRFQEPSPEKPALQLGEPSPEKCLSIPFPKVTPRRPLHEVFTTPQESSDIEVFMSEEEQQMQSECPIEPCPEKEHDNAVDVENFTLHYSSSESESRNEMEDSAAQAGADVAAVSPEDRMAFVTPEQSFSEDFVLSGLFPHQHVESEVTFKRPQEDQQLLTVSQSVPTHFLDSSFTSSDEDNEQLLKAGVAKFSSPLKEVKELPLGNSFITPSKSGSSNRTWSPAKYSIKPVLNKPTYVFDSTSQDAKKDEDNKHMPGVEATSQVSSSEGKVKDVRSSHSLTTTSKSESANRITTPVKYSIKPVLTKPSYVFDPLSIDCKNADELEVPRPITPPASVKEESSNSSPYLGTRSRSTSPSRHKDTKASPTAHVPRSIFPTVCEPEVITAEEVTGDAMIPPLEAELSCPSSTPEKKEVSKTQTLSPYLGTRSKSKSPAKKNIAKTNESVVENAEEKEPESARRNDIADEMDVQNQKDSPIKKAVEVDDTLTEIATTSSSSFKELQLTRDTVIVSPIVETTGRLTRLRKEKSEIQNTIANIDTALKKSQSAKSKLSKKNSQSTERISTIDKQKSAKKKKPKSAKSTQEFVFSFSDPSTSADSDILKALSSSPIVPIQSFIFSPPATRTRAQGRRLLNESTIADGTIGTSEPVNPNQQNQSMSGRLSRQKKTSVKTKKTAELPSSSEGFVNLISPMGTPTTQSEEPVASSSAKHRMILRKTKKSVKLF